MPLELAPTGWGGRMGDILMAANQQPVFTAVSASGNAVFLSGNQVTQYQVGPNGPVQINGAQGKAPGAERSAAPQGHILGQDDPPITAVGAV